MKRPAILLAGVVLVATAGAMLLLRVGTAASDREATAALARKAAQGQQSLESCLFEDLEPGAWADHELATHFAGFGGEWRACLDDLGGEVRSALHDAPDTPAVDAYRQAIRPRPDLGMCETTLALRRALADLQAAAGQDAIDVPAIGCELSGPAIERVAAPPGETMAFVVSREPEVVAYFERDDPSWSHAALRDGAWVPLPRYPDRQVLFDPASLIAVAAGDPQPVFRHDGETWREIGRGPKGFGIRALRSTPDGDLVAVAVGFDEPRIAILRAATVDAPLEVAATRTLDSTDGLAIHLGDDGTALIARDVALEEGRTLEVSRHARGDAEIAVSQVGRFDAEGSASLHACGPDKRWIHRRGLDQERSSMLFSADGGRTFKKAGGVEPDATLTCLDDGLLLAVDRRPGTGTLRTRRYTGDKLPHLEPWVLGGKRAFVALDGSSVVTFDTAANAGLVWTTAGVRALEHPVGVHGPTGDAGLRNVWRMGDQLLVELPIR